MSGQGAIMGGTEIRQALDALGIKMIRSSPYHPQGSAQAERNIQTAKQTLRCSLSKRELKEER